MTTLRIGRSNVRVSRLTDDWIQVRIRTRSNRVIEGACFLTISMKGGSVQRVVDARKGSAALVGWLKKISDKNFKRIAEL